MAETFESCRLALTDQVARLTLDRPPANALDLASIGELDRALGVVEQNPNVSILVLGAEGERAFSAGVEVRDHFPERIDEMLESFHSLCRRLFELDAVSIALVRGYALGGAMELVACCDFVLASKKASFGQPEIELGCFPPLATALYPSRFGAGRAAEIVLLGERLDAREARDLGLVHKVVEDAALESEGDELINRLREKSPAVLRLAKKALRLGGSRALEALPEVETLYREELAATEDMMEGLRAFLEKRKPRWKGR